MGQDSKARSGTHQHARRTHETHTGQTQDSLGNVSEKKWRKKGEEKEEGKKGENKKKGKQNIHRGEKEQPNYLDPERDEDHQGANNDTGDPPIRIKA